MVTNQDLKTFDIKARFILDGGCSTSKFTRPDFINGVYFSKAKVLAVFGNSRDAYDDMSGSPQFMENLGSGISIGEAYAKWFNETVVYNRGVPGTLSECKNDAMLGNVMLGDGTLRISRFMPH